MKQQKVKCIIARDHCEHHLVKFLNALPIYKNHKPPIRKDTTLNFLKKQIEGEENRTPWLEIIFNL